MFLIIPTLTEPKCAGKEAEAWTAISLTVVLTGVWNGPASQRAYLH